MILTFRRRNMSVLICINILMRRSVEQGKRERKRKWGDKAATREGKQ